MKSTKHTKNKRTCAIHPVSYLLLSFMLVLGLGLMACEAPEGPQGAQGEQGPEGPVGPAGEDGSVIHVGEGAPSGEIGTAGDFYLDTNTAELYGPKSEDGWGVPISLQGPPGEDGQDGEDGSQILSGMDAPEASMGSPGDFYLNKSTFDLYGPKTESSWGTPINLQGTANVMYTPWFEPDWDQVDEARHKRLRITEFRLTSEFKAGAVILVYHRDIPSPGNLKDRLLPNTVYFVDGEVARVYRSEVIGNGIYIEVVAYTRDLNPDDYDVEHNRFRYVLIPGSEEILGKAKGSTFSVDFNDYEEVKKYFGIRELE